MDVPSSAEVSRADAVARVAAAAHALAAARELLSHSGPSGAVSLCEYVTGWVNRLIVEILEPEPDEDPERLRN